MRALRRTHVRIALDTSDAPLSAVVAGLPDAAPDLMKPNAEELASFTGEDAARLEADPEAAAAAAAQLVAKGVGAVLATLGGNGAVLVTAEGAWHAIAPPTNVVSTVGAGDSSLFGYLLGDVRGGSPTERLALGVAYGSAAVGLAGTTVPQPLADPPRPGHGASAQPLHWSNDMTEMITRDLVRLDATLGADKLEVIHGLAAVVADAGRTADQGQLVEDALAREATSPTGLPGGIAIPHCRTAAVDVPTLAFARLSPAVEFGAKDGPADLAFLIAAPAGGDATHLKLLTKLARALVKAEFTDALRAAEDPDEVVRLVNDVVGPAEPAAAPAAAARRRARQRRHRHRDDHRARDRDAAAAAVAQPGRRDRLPDRHRAHLHGRRGPRGRRRARRRRHPRRDAGLGRLHAAAPRRDRRGRRGDLRRRRGGPRPRPVRRQAGGLLRREAPDRRRRRDDRRGAPLRRRPERRRASRAAPPVPAAPARRRTAPARPGAAAPAGC